MVRGTFFSLGDDKYFLGTVGLINSLQVTGHTGEIVILDCGFAPDQRQLLATTCTLVQPPDDYSGHFSMDLKLVAPRTHQSDVTIMIDSDIIVTGPLDDVIASAENGNIVAYADPESDRWFAEWEQIFELPCAPRHAAYVCAGFVAFSQRHHPELLDHWLAACKHLPKTSTTGAVHAAVAQSDQDALNAVLMSKYPQGTVDLRQAPEAPQAHELRVGVAVHDVRTLRCSYDGQDTLMLHSAGRPKPWIRLGARKNAYTTLLTRLLASDDAAISVPRSAIPSWLRDGRPSAAYLTALNAYGDLRRLISRRIQYVPTNVRAKVSRLLP